LSDAIIHLHKFDDFMRDVANNLRQAIDILHQKHKQYADEINSYLDSHSKDQSEIKRISGTVLLAECHIGTLRINESSISA